jgi:hypothetical protein
VAVAERRLDEQAAEVTRLRSRMHELDGSLDGIRLILEALRVLPDRIEEIAERAAERVVAAAARTEENRRVAGLSLRVQAIAVAIAAAGVSSSIVLALVR